MGAFSTLVTVHTSWREGRLIFLTSTNENQMISRRAMLAGSAAAISMPSVGPIGYAKCGVVRGTARILVYGKPLGLMGESCTDAVRW